MQSVTQKLYEQGWITPPKFVPEAVAYETEIGSVAYGVSTSRSDVDICGFCVPPKEVVFGHLRGEIPGFGRQLERFDQYQQHNVEPNDEPGCVYDLTIYSIPRFFMLCMENNPNMLEALFTPEDCVRWSTPIAKRARQARHQFLHKGAWHKFRGFAHSQLHKMRNKEPRGGRKALVEEFGYDVKFAYHAVRLMDEVEQILRHGELDLRKDPERLLEIRAGEWTREQVEAYVARKEAELAEVYEHSHRLPHGPDEEAIRQVLLECLEEAWGSLEGIVVRDP